MPPLTNQEITEFFDRWKQQLQEEVTALETADNRETLTAVRLANYKTIMAINKIVDWQGEKEKARNGQPAEIA